MSSRKCHPASVIPEQQAFEAKTMLPDRVLFYLNYADVSIFRDTRVLTISFEEIWKDLSHGLVSSRSKSLGTSHHFS